MSASGLESGVRVVAVGSIGLDTIKTPHDEGSDLLGGSLSYACAASSFFSRTGMVGVVGSDFPAAYRDRYTDFGIDLAGLQTLEGKTFRWSGVYETDMINRRTLSTDLNVFQDFQPALPDPYRRAPFILLGNISPELQLHVFSQVQHPEFVVADTMDLWINTARDPLKEVIGRATMLMLNDSEARDLTGKHSLLACAEDILEMGPRYVVIKKGEHGAMLVSRDGVFIVPAYPVAEVRDPTGAGDSFAGGFLGALAELGGTTQADVRRALLYGAVTASFGVEHFSLEGLTTLRRNDIETRLGDLRDMTRI